MLTLCIDTSYKYLSCALIKDHKLIASFDKECFKRQSEEVFVVLDELFKESKVNKQDIDAICVSIGPGSYTGVRIALTIAKVIATVKKIDLYTISTLRLYAGNKENTMVILNARSNRAYVGIYNKDEVLLEDCVKTLEEIQPGDYQIVGDGSIIGKQDYMPKVSECFLACEGSFIKAENPDHVVPEYLKESQAYMK